MKGLTLQCLKKYRLSIFYCSIFEPLKNDVKNFFFRNKKFREKKNKIKTLLRLTNLRFLYTACHYDILHPVLSAPVSIINNKRNQQ